MTPKTCPIFLILALLCAIEERLVVSEFYDITL